MSEARRGDGGQEHGTSTKQKIGEGMLYYLEMRERADKRDGSEASGFELRSFRYIHEYIVNSGLADRNIDATVLFVALKGMVKTFEYPTIAIRDEEKFLSILASLKTLSE